MTDERGSRLPEAVRSEAELDALLAQPSDALIASLGRAQGDLLILGAGGKMGPTLARMARHAFTAARRPGDVVAVSRFTDARLRGQLEAHGVRTIVADLLNRSDLARLPDAPEVVFMAGRKFGSTGAEHLTWAMNAFMPGLVAERFKDARLVVFSTANVYPFTSPASGGASEATPVAPVGEYAQSCLARERLFEHFADVHGTRGVIVRLAYAVELRYGVLLDIATKVWTREPVDLAMGFTNVIWQGDACDVILRLLPHARTPPLVLNVTGLETLAVRELAERFGRLLGRPPTFHGSEAPTALLTNAQRAADLVGPPATPIDRVLHWVAAWVEASGRTLNKPTHFEVRDGRY